MSPDVLVRQGTTALDVKTEPAKGKKPLEVGLGPDDVSIVGRTKGWLRYRLPRRLRRHNSTPGFVGQKQKWFLLELHAPDSAVRMDCAGKPEFDDWAWVSFWYPLTQVVDFKREVYRHALAELAPHLPVR